MYFRRTSQTKASLQNKNQIDSTQLVSTTQPAGRCFPRRAHSPPNLKPALQQGTPAHHVGCRGNTSPNPGDPFSPGPAPQSPLHTSKWSPCPSPLPPQLGRGSGKGEVGGRAQLPLRLHEGNLISLLERRAGGRGGVSGAAI